MSAPTVSTPEANPEANPEATAVTDQPAPASRRAESALPAHAKVPSRIPGQRPTSGIPFSRLLGVELRKMLDTRAGRWLVISVGVVIAAALVILFFVDGGAHPFGDYMQATTMPMAILLPVVGIMAVTSEWSQRTGLVTFGLEPRRLRVAMAKLTAAVLVGVAALALSFVLAAAAHQGAITFRGIEGSWSIEGLALLGAAGYVLLGLLQGVGFGMLFRNTPAAIVVYFVLPTAWSILGSLISGLQPVAEWLDLNRTMEPLFGGSLTGEQWSQLGASVGLWIVLPVVVGLWVLRRAEVK